MWPARYACGLTRRDNPSSETVTVKVFVGEAGLCHVSTCCDSAQQAQSSKVYAATPTPPLNDVCDAMRWRCADRRGARGGGSLSSQRRRCGRHFLDQNRRALHAHHADHGLVPDEPPQTTVAVETVFFSLAFDVADLTSASSSGCPLRSAHVLHDLRHGSKRCTTSDTGRQQRLPQRASTCTPRRCRRRSSLNRRNELPGFAGPRYRRRSAWLHT